MQALETNADWTGVALAIGIALALIVGFFLVQRILRAWIRWRTGFSDRDRQLRLQAGHHPPLDDAPIQQECTSEQLP